MMKKVMLPALFLLTAVCTSCVTSTPDSSAPGKAPLNEKHRVSTLKVALFPWIPDAASDHFKLLKKRLEEEFERQNPMIDVVLRLEKFDDSYYNPAKIAGWLASL